MTFTLCTIVQHPHVDRITRNVLENLRLPSVRVLRPLPARAGRMVAEEGELASFHVDVSRLAGRDGLHFRWRVAGADGDAGDSARVELRMPAAAAPVTVSVTVSDAGGPIAFGTRTFLPLTREEALRLEIVNLLREMVTAGDPSGSILMPTFDPVLLSRGLVTVNLPWIRDRAGRLSEVTAELMEIWSRSGTRPVEPDPRRPWRP